MKNVNKILSTLSLSASDTREDTIKSIIRTTLLESSNPITLSELKENIDIVYEITLYEIEFNAILKSLQDAGEIIFENTKYTLSQEEINKLITIEARLKSSEVIRYQNFKNFISLNSTFSLQDNDMKLLWDTMKDYLYGCFFQYGIKAIEFLHPQFKQPERILLNHSEILNDAIKKISNKELITLFKIAIDQFPDFATKEDLDFIDELGQKTLAFASLGISPEQAKDDLDCELIDWTLYLDTNFLFSVLNLHSNVENEACKELLKLVLLNKDIIKIQFRYSELTLRELRHKKSDFTNLDENLTDSAIRAILKSDELDEFAKKYYTELLANRDETVHPIKIIDLAEVTLPKKEIYISRNQKQLDALGDSFINEKIVEYQRYINDINQIRLEFSQQHHSNYRPYFRSDSQVRHDVVLREIILSSRKFFKKDEVKTFNEVKYFGLTLDELLIKFDATKTKSKEVTTYPTFFRPSFLLNKLVKLLPIQTADYKKAFIKAVSARGFHKEANKSNDIIQVASYLRKLGIDNESVLLNLISEKLFLDKFHEESAKDGFDSKRFFESELNTILSEKEKAVEASIAEIAKLAEQTKIDKEEKENLKKQKEQKEGDAAILNTAIKQLKQQIKKLEGKSITVITPTLDFEGAEKKSEIHTLQTELKLQRAKFTSFENERRKPLREKYIHKKILKWRLKTLVYIILGLIIFSLTIIYTLYLANWSIEDAANLIKYFLENLIIAAIVWLASVIFTGFFIKRFSDQFSQSNINAYKNNIEKELPDNLKEILED